MGGTQVTALQLSPSSLHTVFALSRSMRSDPPVTDPGLSALGLSFQLHDLKISAARPGVTCWPDGSFFLQPSSLEIQSSGASHL